VSRNDSFFHEQGHVFRESHAWAAEVDVLPASGVPPLTAGRQRTPIHVWAYYSGRPEFTAKLSIRELKTVVEFDAGVLFVHGIGKQRRAETLSQWSAPLARWINAWLKGATEDIARKLHDAPLQAWRLGLANLKGADADFSDRMFYANGLADKAFTSGVGAWRPRSHLTATKTIEHTPALSDAARDDCRDVASPHLPV
jgi:hypothetical protein